MTMLSINTNVGALKAATASYSVNKSMEESMQRLSTGKRINSAADDAAGLQISTRLSAEIGGLNMAARNAADAHSMLASAEGASQEIHTILLRMRELAVQASNGTMEDADRNAVNSEFVALEAEINRINDNTTWGGIALTNGAFTTTLGGVRIDGTTISISGGTISASQNIDYNNLTNTPDITFLSRVNDVNRTTNDLLVYDGTNWTDSTTVTGLTLTNCSGTIRGTSTTPGTHFTHVYANGTDKGLKIAGTEATLDLVGTEDGDHAASVVLRGQNNGGTITYNPTASELRFGTFTATANDFSTHDSEDVRLKILRSNGNVLPGGDNTQDLGSSTARWANIYSADLQLSNEGSVNDVDGTWGQYTIQEGENDLFLLNRRNGKTYKFNLTEVV